MNLTWSNKVIKYILLVFNFIFVITGIIMIAVGVSVKSYFTDYDVFLNDSYFSLPNLLIAIGALIFVISFFGCCGAVKESWFMIFIFSILLSIIFIMELSAGIAGYVLRDKTSSYLTDELLDSMKRYKYNDDKAKNDATTKMWDEIQSTFHCCGAKGAADWDAVIKAVVSGVDGDPTTPTPTTPASTTPTPTPTTPTTTKDPGTKPTNPTTLKPDVKPHDLPASCCKSVPGATGTTTCNTDDTNTTTIYKIGCVQGFGDYLKDHAVTIGGVGLAIGFIQLLGVIFACHLTKQLKHGFYST